MRLQADFDKKELGREGEELAARYLEKQGYRVLERNYRSRWGEIDLIAEKGGELFFVEVKTRRDTDTVSPLELIPYPKQVHISRLAQKYVAAKGWQNRTGRFCLVVVQGGPTPQCEWIPDIFELAWGY